jgi:hypothetical protein
MALRMKPLPERPELVEALRRSAEVYNAMTLDEKRQMFAAQRKSWVIGNMMLDHPDMSREHAEKIYDEIM